MLATPKSLPAARIRQNVLDLLETFPAGLTSAEMAAKRGGRMERYYQGCVDLFRAGKIEQVKGNGIMVWRIIK